MQTPWYLFEIICKTINGLTNWGVTRSNVDEIIFFFLNYILSTCIVLILISVEFSIPKSKLE